MMSFITIMLAALGCASGVAIQWGQGLDPPEDRRRLAGANMATVGSDTFISDGADSGGLIGFGEHTNFEFHNDIGLHENDRLLIEGPDGEFHFPNSSEDFMDEDPRREAYRLQQEQERMLQSAMRTPMSSRVGTEDANKPGAFVQISAFTYDVDPKRADDFGANLKPPEHDEHRAARKTYRGDGAESDDDFGVPAHWQRALGPV